MKTIEIRIELVVPNWWNDTDIAHRKQEIIPKIQEVVENVQAKLLGDIWWGDTGMWTVK